MTNMKAFMAFHSTTLDKEVTAANYAGICTSSVIKEKHIDQPVSDSFLLRTKKRGGGMDKSNKARNFFPENLKFTQIKH